MTMRLLGFGGVRRLPADEHQEMLHEKPPIIAESLLAGAMSATWLQPPTQVWFAMMRPFARAVQNNRERLSAHSAPVPADAALHRT
ncbi:MAG: hypothetical protein AAFR45_09810 [Pseudomonadota bacterium]